MIECLKAASVKSLDLNNNGSVALAVLNLVSLLYIWLKEPFARFAPIFFKKN
jgi:hypothetical protein